MCTSHGQIICKYVWWTAASLFPFIIEVRSRTPLGISIKHPEFSGRSTSQRACPQPTGECGEDAFHGCTLEGRVFAGRASSFYGLILRVLSGKWEKPGYAPCLVYALYITQPPNEKQKIPRAELWSQVWVPWHLAMEQLAKQTQVTPLSRYAFVTEVHEAEQSERIPLQPLPFIKG